MRLLITFQIICKCIVFSIFILVSNSLYAVDYGLEDVALFQSENYDSRIYREVKPKSERGITKHDIQAFQSNNSSPKFYALVIGINDYIEFPKLKTAISDAKSIAALLNDKYQFEVKLLLNASRESLINTLAEYRASLKENDRFLIYYAGHGILDKQADEGYWLPVDAQKRNYSQLISNSTITSLIKAIPARHVLLLSDSCFSGKLTRGISMGVNNAEFDRLTNTRSRSVITSGGLEPVEDGTGAHSIFANSLISILKSNNSYIDATQLFYKLRRLVVLNSDQTPEFSDIRKAGHEGGEFVFVATIDNPVISTVHLAADVLDGIGTSTPAVHKLSHNTVRQIQSGKLPVFNDILVGGEKGPEMIMMPQGGFTMGDIGGRGRENETPLHQVEINYKFALSRYEVTFSQYDKFAQATNRKLPDSNGWGRENRPVINVSWDDANAYAQWLGNQTGQQYRLPSESEWEYAARAGSSFIYQWGNHIGKNKANCNGCQSEWDNLQTANVGSFQGNEFGLFDMLGNVHEWTNDCWNPAYNGAPQDGSTWQNGDCSRRVIRGGAFSYNAKDLRIAARNGVDANSHDVVHGFRLAMSVD